jgi:hypothetical protein
MPPDNPVNGIIDFMAEDAIVNLPPVFDAGVDVHPLQKLTQDVTSKLQRYMAALQQLAEKPMKAL